MAAIAGAPRLRPKGGGSEEAIMKARIDDGRAKMAGAQYSLALASIMKVSSLMVTSRPSLLLLCLY
jgi:hypothetical protein